jgi:hypothetical protein
VIARGWAIRGPRLDTAIGRCRGEFFAGLFILGGISGFASRIIQSIYANGSADALFNGFGISVIVWASFFAGVSLILRDQTAEMRLSELWLASGIVFLAVLPVASFSWIAVTGLSLYVLFSTDVATSRRGAFILLATTIPMFWSPMLFEFFARLILDVDATLVSWLLGSQRSGNIVGFADGSGELVIFPACSSIVNVSLALLCWVTFTQAVDHKRSVYDILWCLLACTAVVTVNVSRITIEGLSQWTYNTFHSPFGDLAVNIIILVLIVGICTLGVRRELFRV